MTTEVLLLPEVLRVLAVDDDQICLEAVGAMLESCKYQVTKCRSGEEAVLLLKDDNIMNRFDIILTNLHMPDVNGIKLLDIIKGLELDVPVVIMSSDEKRESVMEAIIHGACDYIIKPVAMETIQLLWQHVVRKRRIINNGENEDDGVESISGIDEARGGRSLITNKGTKNINRSESSSDHHHHQGESSRKKPRMVWTPALHQQFVDAVNQLGYSNAVPKKIIKLMNLPGLTRGIVASHLQKYRHQLSRQFEDSRKDEVLVPAVQGPSSGAINGDQRNYLLEEYGGYALAPPVSAAMMQMAQTPYHPLPIISVTDDHHRPEYLSNQLTAGPSEIQPVQYCGGVSSSLGSIDEEYGCYIADHHQPGNTSCCMGCESFTFDEIYQQGLMYQH